jgi:Na+/melibiose symporter-like transporter
LDPVSRLIIFLTLWATFSAFNDRDARSCGTIFAPAFSNRHEKIGATNFIRIGFVLAIVDNILKFIGNKNLPMIITGSLLAGMGTTFVMSMCAIFILDCMDYGEWKTGKRLEGVVNSVYSLMGKLGIAFASASVGFIMNAAGYTSEL